MTIHQRPSARRQLVRLATLTAVPLIAATGQPASAAWPVMKPVERPLGLVLVQAAPDAELAPFEELNEALAAARSKLEQLSGAADLAALAADLRRQLEAAEEENRGLRDQLSKAEAARATTERRLDEIQTDLQERDEKLRAVLEREAELKAAAERSGEEAARLRNQLQVAEDRVKAAEQGRSIAEARLGDMQEIVESALGEAADLGQKVTELERIASDREAELAELRNRREAADQALVGERRAKERIARELAEAREALEAQARENAELVKQVASQNEAANKARDVARQNLEAVEEKIALLNRMIADIQPAAGGSGDDAGAAPADRASRFAVPPVRPSADRSELRAVRAANATESDALEAVKNGREGAARPLTLAAAAAQLPMEKRVQARSLLADLKAEKRQDGVVLRVPGEELFALGSESIEPAAHDTLAKVAELIDLFEARHVTIIGHTDAMGDAAYNQTLSERRAELVKTFFMDNYDVADERFTVAGAGEREPIATNTTRAGRRANRRIEVVIRD